MTGSSHRDADSGLVGPRPLLALLLALGVVAPLVYYYVRPVGVLAVNWLVTWTAASVLLTLLFWVAPGWAPRVNGYLWAERLGLSITYSAAVALVAFFISILTCVLLFYFGSQRYPNVTAHWDTLWSLGLAAAVPPVIIVIYKMLRQAGATSVFRWLDASRWLTAESGQRLNDTGRLLVLLLALLEIAMIQGGVVLTGGLSVSPFSVLFVLSAAVAALASERPVYAIFTAVIGCVAAASTEVVGSYEPPGTEFYPTAHVVIFSLAMAIGLLVDLGRKVVPGETDARSTSIEE